MAGTTGLGERAGHVRSGVSVLPGFHLDLSGGNGVLCTKRDRKEGKDTRNEKGNEKGNEEANEDGREEGGGCVCHVVGVLTIIIPEDPAGKPNIPSVCAFVACPRTHTQDTRAAQQHCWALSVYRPIIHL